MLVKSRTTSTDVLVIGAGMSGAAAASELARAGLRVTVVDKGRRMGGRMASRRIGEAVFDHGAQFITARSDHFSSKIQEWCGQGILSEWCRGFSGRADGNPRWRGDPDMRALPQHLLQGIEVLLETRITSIALQDSRWAVAFGDGHSITSAAMVLTAPVPQSLALLDAGRFEVPADLRARLEAIRYERCLAVLAVLDSPSSLPPPGGMAFEDGPVSWIADNQMKGISPVPSVTIHASDAFSLANWDADRGDVGRGLVEAAAPWIRSEVKDFQTHGWLFSKPLGIRERTCEMLHAQPPLVMAGDAFGGPKVEGAARSGWDAAEFLLGRLSPS